MPVYEYVCRKCGHEFEDWSRSVTHPDKPSCPGCNSKIVERKLSVFAARKGTAESVSTPPAGPCGGCCQPDGTCPIA